MIVSSESPFSSLTITGTDGSSIAQKMILAGYSMRSLSARTDRAGTDGFQNCARRAVSFTFPLRAKRFELRRGCRAGFAFGVQAEAMPAHRDQVAGVLWIRLDLGAEAIDDDVQARGIRC